MELTRSKVQLGVVIAALSTIAIGMGGKPTEQGGSRIQKQSNDTNGKMTALLEDRDKSEKAWRGKVEGLQGELLTVKQEVERMKIQQQTTDQMVNTLSLEVQESDYAEAMRQVRESVYKISGPVGHGSGFPITEDIIMTNYHVADDNMYSRPVMTPIQRILQPGMMLPIPHSSIQLPFPKVPLPADPDKYDRTMTARSYTGDERKKGEEFRITPVVLSDGRRAQMGDIQLFRRPPDSPHRPKPVTFGVPKLGMPVIIAGNPGSISDNFTCGKIGNTFMHDADSELWQGQVMFTVDAGLNGGNSGGPAFGIERKLVNGKPTVRVSFVGMISFGFRSTTRLGGGIRSDQIALLAKDLGLQLMSDEELAKAKQEYSSLTKKPPKQW